MLDQKLFLAYASALMRRCLSANTKEAASIQIAGFGLKLNLGIRKAFLNGENLRLTPKQFDILQLLVDRVGEIVTKEELSIALWDTIDFIDENALQVNLTRLKKTMQKLHMEEEIETIRGTGYRLEIR